MFIYINDFTEMFNILLHLPAGFYYLTTISKQNLTANVEPVIIFLSPN